MPQNLDEHTRSVIVKVMSVSLAILGGASYAAQRVVIPRLRRKSGFHRWTGPPLLWGCITALAGMHLLSALMTFLIVALGRKSTNRGHDLHLTQLTSSINFCEDDFVDSPWIAEPANTASSLASYCPLALWGLFGTPSKEWRSRVAGHIRFGVAYVTLFAIGIGSTLLHALLTAGAQGGDELPMLWFVASLSFIGLDIILQRTGINLSELISIHIFREDRVQAQKEGRWILHWLVGGSAVVATAIYCFSRETFLPFYIMFVLYATTATIGLITISFFLKWNDDTQFRASVLLPLSVCTSWMAIVAIVAWVSEMLYCTAAREAHPLVQWIFNRGVHPFWHCSSALLAWLLVQAMLAGQGLQRGWGEPRLQCSYVGVPFVTFPIETRAKGHAKIGNDSHSKQP